MRQVERTAAFCAGSIVSQRHYLHEPHQVHAKHRLWLDLRRLSLDRCLHVPCAGGEPSGPTSCKTSSWPERHQSAGTDICTCFTPKLSCFTGIARCMHAVWAEAPHLRGTAGKSCSKEASSCKRQQTLSQLSGSRCSLYAVAKQSQPWGDGSKDVSYILPTAWKRPSTPQRISASTLMPWGVGLFPAGRNGLLCATEGLTL